MMLVIRTQVYENYGAHDWDGTEPCPQYWKAKGGSEYKILGVPMDANFEQVVMAAGVTRFDNYFEESVIDWSIENDDYLSDFEKDQFAELKIVDIPDGVNWEVEEYDGNEWIAETHRRWG